MNKLYTGLTLLSIIVFCLIISSIEPTLYEGLKNNHCDSSNYLSECKDKCIDVSGNYADCFSKCYDNKYTSCVDSLQSKYRENEKNYSKCKKALATANKHCKK